MKRRTPTLARSRNSRTATSLRRATRPSARRAAPKSGRTRRSAKLTTDHEQIRRWAEARGGQPATVKRTVKGGQKAGVLRIDFPGFTGAQTLKSISWDEWFKTFDERRLGFLYQERTATGKPSRFNKLVCREPAA